MPRPNAPRSIESESNLAERIAYERAKRGLSYEALAKQMTDAGCSIAGSALFRVEKGDPPRRITVDELVTLSALWEIPVSELLEPVELIDQKRASELLYRLQGRSKSLAELSGQLFNDFVDLGVVHRDDPDIYEFVMGHFFQKPLGDIEPSTRATNNAHDGVEAVGEDGVYDALIYLLTDLTGRYWHAISQVTFMYLNTLVDVEQGNGPTPDELKAWVAEWSEHGRPLPDTDEAQERLVERVSTWVEGMRRDG